MNYLPFFDLYLTHTYYPDGRCPDFQIAPTRETQRLLTNYRCSMKPFANGVRISTAVADGAPCIQPVNGAIFTFQLMLHNPDFALFTELEGIEQEQPARLRRVVRSIPARRSGVFAEVEMTYDATWNISAGPQTFEVPFRARDVLWKYYLVTDTTSDQFQIKDYGKENSFTFADPIIWNPTAEPSDRIAAALAEQYPGKVLLSVVSTRSISCKQQARKSVRLLRGDHSEVDALPNPSLRNYTAVSGQHCLFHVLTLFTNPGSISGG